MYTLPLQGLAQEADMGFEHGILLGLQGFFSGGCRMCGWKFRGDYVHNEFRETLGQ